MPRSSGGSKERVHASFALMDVAYEFKSFGIGKAADRVSNGSHLEQVVEVTRTLRSPQE